MPEERHVGAIAETARGQARRADGGETPGTGVRVAGGQPRPAPNEGGVRPTRPTGPVAFGRRTTSRGPNCLRAAQPDGRVVERRR